MAVFVVLFWEICYTLFCRRNGVEKKSPDWILAGPVGQMAEKNAVSIG